MCLCESCAVVDDCCCSLEKKMKVYAILNLAAGVIFLILVVLMCSKETENLIGGILCVLLLWVGAILILLGVYKQAAIMFMIGVVLVLLTSPLLIVSIFFTICGCRYYSTVLKS